MSLCGKLALEGAMDLS